MTVMQKHYLLTAVDDCISSCKKSLFRLTANDDNQKKKREFMFLVLRKLETIKEWIEGVDTNVN